MIMVYTIDINKPKWSNDICSEQSYVEKPMLAVRLYNDKCVCVFISNSSRENLLGSCGVP